MEGMTHYESIQRRAIASNERYDNDWENTIRQFDLSHYLLPANLTDNDITLRQFDI